VATAAEQARPFLIFNVRAARVFVDLDVADDRRAVQHDDADLGRTVIVSTFPAALPQD
jgi:hypothetical protein